MNDDIQEDNLFSEIDKMYCTWMCRGFFTKKGSFIAFTEGEKLYVAQGIVTRCRNLFELIAKGNTPAWVLASDDIGLSKLYNEQIARVFIVSEIKQECEMYKENLKERMRLILEKQRKYDELFEILQSEIEYRVIIEKQMQIQTEIDDLQKKIEIVNLALPI